MGSNLDGDFRMRHTGCVSSLSGNQRRDIFHLKETHFFALSPVSPSPAQLQSRCASRGFWPLQTVLPEASAPLQTSAQALPLLALLWKDWPRCSIRRAWLKIIRSETVLLTQAAMPVPVPTAPSDVFTR